MDERIQVILEARDLMSGEVRRITGEVTGLTQAKGRLQTTAIALGTALGNLATDALRDVVAAIGASVGEIVEFERAMLNVNSIAKVGTADFAAMKDAVVDLSTEVPQSASTLAAGLYDIQSSGFAGREGIEVLDAAARAASAGLTSTATSAAGLTAILNAYGLESGDAAAISDIMFKTVDRGVISFEELAGSIGKTTALSAPLGVNIEEVAAAIAVMTRKGIDAENATTQLNAIMQTLLAPSNEAKDLAAELGLGWDAQALAGRGLSGVLADLVVKTRGNQEQMATLLGDARAIRGAFVLAADGGAEFRDEIALMRDAAGATDTALSYQKQGLAYNVGLLGNQIGAAAIRIGDRLLPAITDLVSGLTDWLAENGDVIDGVGDLLAALLALAGMALELGKLWLEHADVILPALVAALGVRFVSSLAAAEVRTTALTVAMKGLRGAMLLGLPLVAEYAGELDKWGQTLFMTRGQVEDLEAVQTALNDSSLGSLAVYGRLKDAAGGSAKAMDALVAAFTDAYEASGDPAGAVEQAIARWERQRLAVAANRAELSDFGLRHGALAAELLINAPGIADAIEQPFEEGADAAIEEIDLMYGRIAALMREREQQLVEAGGNAAQAWFDPAIWRNQAVIVQAELTEANAALLEAQRAGTAAEVAEAENRVLKLTQEAIELEVNLAQTGDRMAQRANLTALLTSDFMTTGLNSKDPEIQATFQGWFDALSGTLDRMVDDSIAQGPRVPALLEGGVATGSPQVVAAIEALGDGRPDFSWAYAAGAAVPASIGLGISENAWKAQSELAGMAQVMRAIMPSSEPKDPSSPFRGITTWGGRIIGILSDDMRAHAGDFAAAAAFSTGEAARALAGIDLQAPALDLAPVGIGPGPRRGGPILDQLGAGGLSVQLTYSPQFSTASPSEARAFAQAVIPELVRELRRERILDERY